MISSFGQLMSGSRISYTLFKAFGGKRVSLFLLASDLRTTVFPPFSSVHFHGESDLHLTWKRPLAKEKNTNTA